VIQNTSAQERLLVRGAAAEVSSKESTEDLVEAKINGMFCWKADNSQIIHEVAKCGDMY
jgi:hypothetical protein